MRKLLNTLYVTSENSYLSLDGENVVVLEEHDDLASRTDYEELQRQRICCGKYWKSIY